MFGYLAKIDVLRQRHGAGMNSQNLQPGLTVRNSNFNFAVEAAWAAQCRVENLGNVGRANDDDLAAGDKTIHQAEKLRYHALFDFARYFGALGSDSIDLIYKEDGGRMPCRFLENFAEFGFAFAIKLPHDFRAVEVYEVHTALGRNRAGQQGLTCARRSVQQHALRGEDPQPFEHARILQGKLDDL